MSHYDFADELDDYEYHAEDFENDDGMTEEDKAKMAVAVKEVRKQLGKRTMPLKDNIIEDLLWDSYYDVEGTVIELLGEYCMAGGGG